MAMAKGMGSLLLDTAPAEPDTPTEWALIWVTVRGDTGFATFVGEGLFRGRNRLTDRGAGTGGVSSPSDAMELDKGGVWSRSFRSSSGLEPTDLEPEWSSGSGLEPADLEPE